MDQEEGQSTTVFRYKSPTFRNSETQLLLELIDKYKYPLLIKSTLFSVTHTKDKAWAKLTKEFNTLNAECEYERTIDVLKTKWDNLKRLARRSSKNGVEPMFDKFHSEIVKNVIKICETDVGPMVEPEFDAEQGEVPQTKNPLHNRIVNLLQSKLNNASHSSFDSDNLPAMQDDDSEDFSLPSCSTGCCSSCCVDTSTNCSIRGKKSKNSKELKFTNNSFDCKEELKGLEGDTADDSDGEKKKAIPISPFSARDCRLLLHCVRQEKNVLFSNSPVARKQKAWSRIARSFNRQSPTKRSPPELKKKFQNLKAMASRVNNAKKCFTGRMKKYEELDNENLTNKIKFEPKSECTEDMNFDNDDDDDCLDEALITNNGTVEVNHDPLSNGVTPVTGIGLFNHTETKEADKLKIQLLNYELETAKLQRKRIEDAIESEKTERDLRALETSLRIRAARLEVLAAEAKIPPLHPALHYTSEETRAQQYLTYRTT